VAARRSPLTQIPDKRGLSVAWANGERAAQSKPFVATTTYLATMQDPQVTSPR
jgi:hypothetical protein